MEGQPTWDHFVNTLDHFANYLQHTASCRVTTRTALVQVYEKWWAESAPHDRKCPGSGSLFFSLSRQHGFLHIQPDNKLSWRTPFPKTIVPIRAHARKSLLGYIALCFNVYMECKDSDMDVTVWRNVSSQYAYWKRAFGVPQNVNFTQVWEWLAREGWVRREEEDRVSWAFIAEKSRRCRTCWKRNFLCSENDACAFMSIATKKKKTRASHPAAPRQGEKCISAPPLPVPQGQGGTVRMWASIAAAPAAERQEQQEQEHSTLPVFEALRNSSEESWSEEDEDHLLRALKRINMAQQFYMTLKEYGVDETQQVLQLKKEEWLEMGIRPFYSNRITQACAK